ncbi:tetratricopeptide repeat protein [Puteibacter caeruleilacunae]|nr:tetratricopeptide repeat protein [Puteibacter caeruleilacunae]
MNYKVISSILLIFISTLCFAAKENPVLTEANQLYAEAKYQEAIVKYEQLLKQNLEAGELYYNLGNAYYKTGDIPKAILNYERAKLLSPNDEDITYNLELANQHVLDKIEPLPQVFFLKWKHNIINSKSADEWAWISAITFIFFIILLGIFILSGMVSLKKMSFSIGISLFIVSIMTFTFASSQKHKINKRKNAIVFTPSVTVKSSPAESGTNLFVIHEGLKVQVTDSVTNWKEIKLADGNKGWLRDTCVVKI